MSAERLPFFWWVRLGAHEHELVVVATSLAGIAVRAERRRTDPGRALDLHRTGLEHGPAVQSLENVIAEVISCVAGATEHELHADLDIGQDKVVVPVVQLDSDSRGGLGGQVAQGDGAVIRTVGGTLGPHGTGNVRPDPRSEEHTSELQSRGQLVCRL